MSICFFLYVFKSYCQCLLKNIHTHWTVCCGCWQLFPSGTLVVIMHLYCHMVVCVAYRTVFPSVGQLTRQLMMPQHGDFPWQCIRLMCLDQQMLLATISLWDVLHTFCVTLCNTVNNCQTHQLLLCKATYFIIFKHGIHVSNYNYSIGW